MTARRDPWVLVALLWIVALLNYLDRQVVFAIFPLLERDLGASAIQLGLLGTAFLWVYGALSPFGGYFADRFGRRRIIVISLVVWSTVTCLTGLAHNYGALLVARGLMGVSEACYLPAALALIADTHSSRTRSIATGLHQSGLYAGMALGGAGGGWMAENYGWRVMFLLLGAFGVVYALVVWLGLRDDGKAARPRAGERPSFATALGELLRSVPFAVLVVANSLASLAYWCVYTWLALFLFERFQLSLTAAGFSSTFYIQAASFAGVLAGGWLSDRWVQRNVRGRARVQAIGLAAAGPFLFLVGAAGSQSLVLVCLVLFGLGRGFYDCNLMPVVCQIIPQHLRATAYGVLNLTSCIVGGVMAAAGGYFKASIGLAGAIEISGVALMLAAALVLLVRIPETA